MARLIPPSAVKPSQGSAVAKRLTGPLLGFCDVVTEAQPTSFRCFFGEAFPAPKRRGMACRSSGASSGLEAAAHCPEEVAGGSSPGGRVSPLWHPQVVFCRPLGIPPETCDLVAPATARHHSGTPGSAAIPAGPGAVTWQATSEPVRPRSSLGRTELHTGLRSGQTRE